MAAPTAEQLASKQRDISIAEFFEKNRHLLGFDNPRKALLTTIKEAVDNSLDACEEARILPDISVEVIEMSESRYRVIVEDNGPGIVKAQIPKIFAKLLYGSKFHRLRQSRGQQGIGISAAVLYAQLTTGRPAKIISKTATDKPGHYYELHIDTQKNQPEIVKEDIKEWNKDHGTKIELDLEASYLKGNQSVDEYLKETAIINPHVHMVYLPPKGDQIIFPRAVNELPKEPQEIKPHPYGLELGMLMKMLKSAESKTLSSFLQNELSRVGSTAAKEICEKALINPKIAPDAINLQDGEKLIHAIKNTRIMAPSTDCIVPLGEDALEKGIRKEINAEFYCSVSRPPTVYRGNPFVMECTIAYGGDQSAEGSVNVLRFANRVPLLYQQGACAFTKAISQTNWKPYGLQQSNGSLPVGPVTILIHMASVWVPFTSESKEAIAHYPEIVKEIKLVLQEAGRKLQSYIHKKKRVGDEFNKRMYIEKYIPHISEALHELIAIDKGEQQKVQVLLKEILEKSRGQLEDLSFDPTKNEEFDETMANIGSRKKSEDSYFDEEDAERRGGEDEETEDEADAEDGEEENTKKTHPQKKAQVVQKQRKGIKDKQTKLK